LSLKVWKEKSLERKKFGKSLERKNEERGTVRANEGGTPPLPINLTMIAGIFCEGAGEWRGRLARLD